MVNLRNPSSKLITELGEAKRETHEFLASRDLRFKTGISLLVDYIENRMSQLFSVLDYGLNISPKFIKLLLVTLSIRL